MSGEPTCPQWHWRAEEPHRKIAEWRDGDVLHRPSWFFVSVVDAVAMDAVIEATSDCADRARAEAVLAASLAAVRAPRRSNDGDGRWRLEMTVSSAAPGIKSADAQIRDDGGRVVAERSVSDKTTGSCLSLARAVSAWAQIVVDDELTRAHEQVEHDDFVRARDTQVEVVVGDSRVGASRANADTAESQASTTKDRALEVGTTLFLRNGAARSGGIFGASPFFTFAFGGTWVLRPSLALGTSTARVPPDQSNSDNLTYAGGRIDVCKRMPGNYIERRGIELDACAGSDAAYVWSRLVSHVRASVGPSAVLRGELGQNFALEIRTMVGANLVRDGDVAPLVVSGELGGSVRFR